MKIKPDYSLYLCTDRSLMRSPTIEECVEQAIAGGVTVVQLREKDASSLEFYEMAKRVLAITRKAGVPLLINDRVDIALAVDADGVHVGQRDLPVSVVRHLLGNEKIVGASVHSVEESLKAVQDGADYLGVGAMFSTQTKMDAIVVSFEELAKIRQAISVPIILIGGINQKTIPDLKKFGADGYAVVSAIVAADSVELAARDLKKLILAGV